MNHLQALASGWAWLGFGLAWLLVRNTFQQTSHSEKIKSDMSMRKISASVGDREGAKQTRAGASTIFAFVGLGNELSDLSQALLARLLPLSHLGPWREALCLLVHVLRKRCLRTQLDPGPRVLVLP